MLHCYGLSLGWQGDKSQYFAIHIEEICFLDAFSSFDTFVLLGDGIRVLSLILCYGQ